ncbi:hypothetical protein E5S70_17470 [Ensifer adhaerens]|uniref:hypothetical protein n=1 Tax=Ensifer canadensis TaxID=555315 RepID=UPI00148F691C|nr:hypothetical protein [Ensifer canadensis]NOV17843.1 hypothetical protein [Ensifer canadensis]
MTDRPILFSAPMVRALIEGRKTQTRRLFNGIEQMPNGTFHIYGGIVGVSEEDVSKHAPDYVRVTAGDRFYVCETHYRFGHWQPVATKRTKAGRQKWQFVEDSSEILFDAPALYRKGRHHQDPETPAWHKRLGRFMFRRHSRLALIVTDVRVERLQDISEADAMAEGVEPAPDHPGWWKSQTDGKLCPTARDAYGDLWNAINGEGAWQANPWVVAYTFTVHRGNIDQIDREAA